MDELRFDGRVAVITGAGRGLGREYALLLARRGAKVVVNDPGSAMKGDGIDAGPADAVVAEIRAAGGEAIANTDSVATPAGGAAIVQAAIDAWGRIDILVHNAGNVRYGSIRELSLEDFDAVLDVHLRGAFYVVRAAFPLMADAGYGRVILTSSVGGLYGNRNVLNYGVSKAGIIGLSNVVAIEGEEANVRCNVIVPGAVTRMAEGVDTSFYPPMGPDLVAPVVGWLAHESCAVSGEMFVAIAGRVARAYVAETRGVVRTDWSIEAVAAAADGIRDTADPLLFPPVPHGHVDHIVYSCDAARAAGAK